MRFLFPVTDRAFSEGSFHLFPSFLWYDAIVYMIYAHMGNYSTITVGLVTQCKNQLYAKSTTLKRLTLNKEAVSMNTPARAVKNTNEI
jgi:hypothetical protein